MSIASDERIKSEHPSFGMLEISRVSCHPGISLFGSSIKHSNVVALRVKKASLNRHLHKDWIHSDETIAECYMSYSQFTQAIMSMNTEGTPITLTQVGKERIKNDFDREPKDEEFSREFQDKLDEVLGSAAKSAKDAENLLRKKGTLTKAERDELISSLYRIHQDIASNIKFVNDQFNRQMNQTITEAKGEVEAFVETKVRSLGIDALRTEFGQIEFDGETKNISEK
jgi:hypothetical protein